MIFGVEGLNLPPLRGSRTGLASLIVVQIVDEIYVLDSMRLIRGSNDAGSLPVLAGYSAGGNRFFSARISCLCYCRIVRQLKRTRNDEIL
jgi:hypothetical protein